jgi:hypothetical protein
MTAKISLTPTEQEVIILMAVWEMINSMVKRQILEVVGTDPDSEIRFGTGVDQKLFNILMVDFLSPPNHENFNLPTVKKVNKTDNTYLYYLSLICGKPCFAAGSIQTLINSVEDFKNWLEKECTVDRVWFPSINVETNLTLKRIEFIKICGNISKHNFTRMDQDAKLIKEILEKNTTTTGNKIKLDIFDALRVLPEFYDWFHSNIFNYHSSAIAEFLNNIRWGIYEYLQPEFNRSLIRDKNDPLKYSYTYPSDINNLFARSIYWDLMNNVRSKPYMEQFKVTKFLKMRY